MINLILDLQSLELTDEQFFQLCINNRDLLFERDAQESLIIMSPTDGETGNRNAEITYQLQAWSRQNKLGLVFDSSTGFKLPKGGDRSPDAAWITLEKWQNLTPQQQEKFLPLSPDFVIELLSPSDQLITIQDKMQEYLINGTLLGWLINPQDRQVEIYRQGLEVEILESPQLISGEDVLPGFILELEPIWLS